MRPTRELVVTGHAAEAQSRLQGVRSRDGGFGAADHDHVFLLYLGLLAEAVALVGDPAMALEVLDLVEAFGSVDSYLGQLLATLGRLDDADRVFTERCSSSGSRGAAAVSEDTGVAGRGGPSSNRGGDPARAAEYTAKARALRSQPPARDAVATRVASPIQTSSVYDAAICHRVRQ